MKLIKYTAKNRHGRRDEYAVRPPTEQEFAQGRQVYAEAYKQAIEAGALCRTVAWTADQQAEADRMRAKIAEKEAQSATDEELRPLRRAVFEFTKAHREAAESIAEDKQFRYLASKCIVHAATGQRVFSSLDDYEKHASEQHAYQGACRLFKLLHPGAKTHPQNTFAE